MNREGLGTKLFARAQFGIIKLKWRTKMTFSLRKKKSTYVIIYSSGLFSSRKAHQASCQREMKLFRINSNMRSHVADLEYKDACKITLIFIQIGI